MPEPTIETIQKIKDKIAEDPTLKKILEEAKRKKEIIFSELLKRKKSEFNFSREEMIKTEFVHVKDEEKTTDLYFLINTAFNLVEPFWEVEETNLLQNLDELNKDFFKLNEKELKKIREIFLKI